MVLAHHESESINIIVIRSQQPTLLSSSIFLRTQSHVRLPVLTHSFHSFLADKSFSGKQTPCTFLLLVPGRHGLPWEAKTPFQSPAAAACCTILTMTLLCTCRQDLRSAATDSRQHRGAAAIRRGCRPGVLCRNPETASDTQGQSQVAGDTQGPHAAEPGQNPACA